MKKAIKKRGKIVQVYHLGDGKHPVIKELISEGKIKAVCESEYELFSQEAVNGTGQRASSDYYCRVDSSGSPYPISPEFIANNFQHIEGDDYEQIPTPVDVWTINDEICPEIEYIIKNKGLIIDATCDDKCFSAPLWGTILSANKDAYIVIYEIRKNDEDEITAVDFSFVEKNEFEKTYTWM